MEGERVAALTCLRCSFCSRLQICWCERAGREPGLLGVGWDLFPLLQRARVRAAKRQSPVCVWGVTDSEGFGSGWAGDSEAPGWLQAAQADASAAWS